MKYQEFEKLFLEKAKLFIEKYDIDGSNKEAIKDIITYFAGINTRKYPLTKGLLIRGCNGSGKTITFKIIQKIVSFAINNVRDIVADFNIGGFETIDSYIKTKERVFDDLGNENMGKFYGNNTEVMEELIIRRYDHFQNSGLKTHFTTNMGNTQLKSRYGIRAYDRLIEMVSIVILGDNNISRRDKYNPIDKNKPKQPDTLIDKEKANREAVIRSIEKIYNGEDILNALYSDCYDYLKNLGILKLSESARKDITIKAEKLIIADKQIKIDSLTNKGNLKEAKNLAKRMFDLTDLKSYQKRIAVIEFLQAKKEMDIPINEILNK